MSIFKSTSSYLKLMCTQKYLWTYMTKVLILQRLERYFVSFVTFVITFDLPFQNNFLLIEVKLRAYRRIVFTNNNLFCS